VKDLYENDSLTKKLCDSIHSVDDLKKKWFNYHMNSPFTIMEKRHIKMSKIYRGAFELRGHGLELGFGMGTSIYWLLNHFENITLDGIDFCSHMEKLIPYIKQLDEKRVKKLQIIDAALYTSGAYDFINSCSFFEHLPSPVYWKVIKNCYKLLKPGGWLGVYLDQTPGPQHIRVVPPEVTREELESIGFRSITNYLFCKP